MTPRPAPSETAQPSLLRRLRRAFLVLGIAVLLAQLSTLLAADAHSPGMRLVAALAVLGLAGHWWRGYRRGGFSAVGEVAELLTVLAVLRLTPGDPGLPLFVVILHSLYGSVGQSLVRVTLYCAGIAGLHLWAGSLDLEMAERAAGLVIAGVLVPLLAGAIQRYEESEARLRSVVENSSDAACIVGRDGKIRWQGASIHRILGREARELIGVPFTMLVHPRDRPEVVIELSEAAETPGGSRTFTARLRHADGSLRWVEALARNLLEDRHVEGILLDLRDVTERHRLEAERRALEEDRARDASLRVEVERLGERLEAERERQALEVRLQRSQRLESVGQLAGGVAHDFNNLLSVILNYAGFIRDELPGDHALVGDLVEIEHAARRGANLTRQLLLFAQRKVDTPEVLDLDAVIGEMIALLDRSLGAHVELRFAPGPGVHTVEADPASLEQVIVNLVVNARDALGCGGTVAVRTHEVVLGEDDAGRLALSSGHYAVLTVADDGAGMDEETLARACEPFFSTKEVGSGTGLGLATVHGVATRAGGGLHLHSIPGEGTRVEVFLPITARPVATAAGAGAPPAAADGEGARVLVVDDEAPVRRLVERILERAGHTVSSADSGPAALAAHASAGGAFDLVVTDITMPGMTGLELARALRGDRPGQPVLFMSGYSEALLMPGTTEQGALLSKPFSGPALVAAVAAVLEASAAGGPPAFEATVAAGPVRAGSHETPEPAARLASGSA